jgi:hypothetical protein
MKDKKCKGYKHECGNFSGDETKEEKLKHLKECKQDLVSKIEEIDKTIRELE